jgi:hypothetical protein
LRRPRKLKRKRRKKRKKLKSDAKRMRKRRKRKRRNERKKKRSSKKKTKSAQPRETTPLSRSRSSRNLSLRRSLNSLFLLKNPPPVHLRRRGRKSSRRNVDQSDEKSPLHRPLRPTPAVGLATQSPRKGRQLRRKRYPSQFLKKKGRRPLPRKKRTRRPTLLLPSHRTLPRLHPNRTFHCKKSPCTIPM